MCNYSCNFNFSDNVHQQTNKSDNTELYSSNNFNDQLHAESITSVSEKSDNCDKSYNVSPYLLIYYIGTYTYKGRT